MLKNLKFLSNIYSQPVQDNYVTSYFKSYFGVLSVFAGTSHSDINVLEAEFQRDERIYWSVSEHFISFDYICLILFT